MAQSTWNVALLQMDVAIGEPERNIDTVRRMAAEAMAAEAEERPDVLVIPEMWNTGYALDRIHELADPEGRQLGELLAGLAREYKVNIVGGSIAEKRADGGIYNTTYAFDRKGRQVGEYSKMHLFRLMDEEKYLRSGDQLGKLELDGIPAGMMICYDIRFPELSRKLALEGARILFVPAEWPHPRLHHWRTLQMARAIENQMYVISCNRVGTSGTTEFFGHSMIIDPWGEVLAEGGEQEGIVRARIDLGLVEEVRSRIPIFADRRPSLY